MRAYERLISYAIIHTASAENVTQTPTTERQIALSRQLAEELRLLGLEGVYEDEHAYVYGFLPASPGFEDRPCMGLIAHIDTSPEFPGKNVKPQLVRNYDGGDLPLGESGRVLSVSRFPHLRSLKGQTLITTDGTTLLGADDKAGIAEIVTACERILEERLPHGRIAVCFTPDEEVGHGAALLDLERLGADFAFTVDGGELNEINFETFNAASAHWEIQGFSIHPGSAKDRMINANLVAMELNALLPALDVPAHTEGYEGFFHLSDMQGSVAHATMDYIVRDHDPAVFKARIELLERVEKELNGKYGPGTVSLRITPSYRNMREVLEDHMEILELAKAAIEKSGLTCVFAPIRGGTDGAQLSFRGLPCPNLGTGGYCFHGPYEHITVEAMDKAVEILLHLASGVAGV